jgi:hypothetical protein
MSGSVDVLVRILAIAGAAALGGVLLGLLTQLLVRATTTRKLPPWPLNTVRVLGAVASGWLVALWLFGGGGLGIGGSGGWGLGSGTGRGEGDKNLAAKDKGGKDKGSKGTDSAPPVPPDESLRVEVLGDPALKRIAGGGNFDPARCYRIAGAEGGKLLTLAEVKEALRQRQQQSPPLRRLVLALYKDSPTEQGGRVEDLKAWAGDLVVRGTKDKLRVDFSLPDAEAPAR